MVPLTKHVSNTASSFLVLRQVTLSHRSYRTDQSLQRRDHIPTKNQDKDEKRIALVMERLDFQKYGVSSGDLREFVKCLYPKKDCIVTISNGQKYYVGHLQLLGASLLRFNLTATMMETFRRSPYDVNGLDFNYSDKMDHLSVSRKSPNMLLRRFIRRNYQKLARVPMPESAVPARIQKVFDQRSFNAVIGYVSLLNDEKVIDTLLRERLAKPVLKGIFGH